MLQATFPNYQKDLFTGEYKNIGDRVLSVVRSVADENVLLFDNGGTVKRVPVRDCGGGFVYQIRKKYINANGGASGLYEFLKRELETTTGGFYLTVFNKVFEYMS